MPQDQDDIKGADAMKQAPTPGPLDMDAAVRALHEALGGNGWAYSNYGGDELNSERPELEAGVLAVLSLAPPAPVEAGGSEPSWKTALLELKDKLWIARCDSRDEGFRAAAERAIKMADDADWSPLNLRPQPSGETREAVALIIRQSGIDRGWAQAGDAEKLADRILALIRPARPAPVASGGQHSSGEVEAAWLEAEAQLSEISAAIGSVRFMDPPDGGSVTLAEQVRRMRLALEEAESVTDPVAETAGEAVGVVSGCARADLYTADLPTGTPLYASPVPAQDDDKLRRAVEALGDAYRRWVINEGESVDVLERVGPVLAALKSTAAQEGEKADG